MIISTFEFWLMNNPIRSFIQDKLEARRMRRYSQLKAPRKVLEIGCGQGVGTKIIKKRWNAKKVYGVDLDSKMIARAEKKNRDTDIHFEVGDACELRFTDNTFDAIFDFGVIHHIPDWKDCLSELKRVLKPRGELLIEDFSLDMFQKRIFGKIIKKLTDHPYEDMYTEKEFFQFLKKIGFMILKEKHYSTLGVPYFLVIATKPHV